MFNKFFAAAFAACFTVAGAAHAFETDQVPEANKWAAVAWSKERGAYGKSTSETSEYVGKQAALRACHNWDCEIKSYVERGCMAVAKGVDRDLNWIWHGFGGAKFPAEITDVRPQKEATRLMAGEVAKAACDAAARDVNCNVIDTWCTWDIDTGSDELAIAGWIRTMGGEQDQGLRNVVQLVNVAAQAYLLNLGLTYDQSSCVSGRRWARVQQVATTCRITVDQLDTLYADANR